MNETTIAAPLSGEEIVEALRDELSRKLFSDCHLNPALAYLSFEAHLSGIIIVRDQGREEQIRVEIDLMDRPPNVVRQAAGLPIPTLVEDAAGKKEIKAIKYGRRGEPEVEHEKTDPTKKAGQAGAAPLPGTELKAK